MTTNRRFRGQREAIHQMHYGRPTYGSLMLATRHQLMIALHKRYGNGVGGRHPRLMLAVDKLYGPQSQFS